MIRTVLKEFKTHILILSIILYFLLFTQRISVADLDALSYVQGAFSLKTIGNYVNLNGNPLNHWSPGYSFLLSLIPLNPLKTAFIINLISLVICSYSIFKILEKQKIRESFLITIYITFGFLYSISIYAKPDILTFALFFFSFYIYLFNENPNFKIFFLSIIGSLIFFKKIAILFLPSIIIADIIFNKKIKNLKIFLIPLFIYLLTIACIVYYDYIAIGKIQPDTHLFRTTSYFYEVKRFFYEFFRLFTFNWYGSIINSPGIFFFILINLFTIFLITKIKLNFNILFINGIILLFLFFLLQLLINFHFTPRLLAYSFILILLSFNFDKINFKKWTFIIALIFINLVFQKTTLNNQGYNNAIYQNGIKEIIKYVPKNYKIYSNSFGLLEINGISQEAINSINKLKNLKENHCFIYFDHENYDRILTIIYFKMHQVDKEKIPKNLIKLKELNKKELYCNKND